MTVAIGANARSLVKEAKRASSDFFPYNDAAVRSCCQDIAFLLEEITSTIETHDESTTPLDEGATSKIQILHATIKHIKRCLVAYVLHRAAFLVQKRSTIDSFNHLLSADEKAYCEKYLVLLSRTYHRAYAAIEWGCGMRANAPPAEVFVRVIAMRDCGEIVTENGSVVLNAGSIAFLLRSDVQHLLISGDLRCL